MSKTDPTPVFYRGLDPKSVTQRHLRYAQALADSGVEFEMLLPEQHVEAAALVNASLAEGAEEAAERGAGTGDASEPHVELLGQDSGIIALKDGVLVSAAVVSAVQFEDEPGDGDGGEAAKTALFLRGLGTHTPYRGQGLATVLLGLLPQVLQQAGLPTKAQVITRAPEPRARFFHRAGYMVELPHAEVPASVGQVAFDLLPDFGPDSRWAHQSLA